VYREFHGVGCSRCFGCLWSFLNIDHCLCFLPCPHKFIGSSADDLRRHVFLARVLEKYVVSPQHLTELDLSQGSALLLIILSTDLPARMKWDQGLI
jgi:hypothetical protein